MNRIDFMKQLESLLQNISPAEREEALQYYNEYFNDAGPENEQSVLEALGNPAKVAENIKKDLNGNGYGDNSYQRAVASDRALMQYQQGYQGANTTAADKGENKLSTGMIVLIVILCILASPLLVGVCSTALGAAVSGLGIILSLVTAWFSLILAFGMVAVVLAIVMLVLVIVGISCLFTDALVGIGLIGAGMICGGVGILFLMLTVTMAGIATPAAIKGCMALGRKLFGKETAAKA